MGFKLSGRDFLGGRTIKVSVCCLETRVRPLGREDSPGEGNSSLFKVLFVKNPIDKA